MNCRPELGGRGVELARHVGRGRGVVDKNRAGLHAGKGAVGAQRDGAQVVVIADAAKHDVGAGRRQARQRRRARAWVAANSAHQASALAGLRL
jgi:predicted HD phosphohydrolase